MHAAKNYIYQAKPGAWAGTVSRLIKDCATLSTFFAEVPWGPVQKWLNSVMSRTLPILPFSQKLKRTTDGAIFSCGQK